MLNKFYQKQQVIMTLLGYYDGQCDGVWGPKCIEAKRHWELQDAFEPATPSNGLPFNGRGKLPAGMHYSFSNLDILWDKWDEDKAQEILKAKGNLVTPEVIRRHVQNLPTSQQAPVVELTAVSDTVQPTTTNVGVLDTVKQEESTDAVEVDDVEDSSDAKDADASAGAKNNQQKQNWTKNRK